MLRYGWSHLFPSLPLRSCHSLSFIFSLSEKKTLIFLAMYEWELLLITLMAIFRHLGRTGDSGKWHRERTSVSNHFHCWLLTLCLQLLQHFSIRPVPRSRCFLWHWLWKRILLHSRNGTGMAAEDTWHHMIHPKQKGKPGDGEKPFKRDRSL